MLVGQRLLHALQTKHHSRQHKRRLVTCSDDNIVFTYKSEDGRKKATMEKVFSPAKPLQGDQPWQFSWQMNERVLIWNDELRERLVKRVVGTELGITDEQVDQRLNQLVTLIPALQAKLGVIKPTLLARFCASPEAIAQALLSLKTLFPAADVGFIALRCPSLVLGDVCNAAELAKQLRELLSNTEDAVIDSLVEQYPDTMLDVEGLMAAMKVTERVMPDRDIERLLARDPGLIFASQRGSQLIPYDPAKPPTADEQA